jgi:Lrp/AsnC family transcriptional regulator for asnA, asnC and gidA
MRKAGRQETTSERVENGVAAEPRYGAVAGMRIDALDRQLIETLQENGRESFRQVAERLHVAEGTVRARYRRLASANVVQVTAITNPLKLGFDAMAMIGVRTAGPAKQVAEVLGEWPEASYVVVTFGHFDLLVELVCVDNAHLHDVIDRIRRVEAVTSAEAFIYYELTKQMYNWGARPAQDGGTGRATK